MAEESLLVVFEDRHPPYNPAERARFTAGRAQQLVEDYEVARYVDPERAREVLGPPDREADGGGGPDAEGDGDETGAEDEDPLEGVPLTRSAEELAREEGLAAGDFAGREPGGERGDFLKSQVEAIVEEGGG